MLVLAQKSNCSVQVSLYIVGFDHVKVLQYPKYTRRDIRCPLYCIRNMRYTKLRVILQNGYHQKGIDEEITNQSTKLCNLNSIQSYKRNTTKNIVNTESAHMKVKVHKCYITKSNR